MARDRSRRKTHTTAAAPLPDPNAIESMALQLEALMNRRGELLMACDALESDLRDLHARYKNSIAAAEQVATSVQSVLDTRQ